MNVAFEKFEGIGNDFIVVRAASPELLDPTDAIALCDRHYGIGGDGVLLLSPGSSPGARARMTVLNSDGSRPEMCGNGLRCVALAAAEPGESDEFVVDTDAGPRRCKVDRNADGKSALVTTSMGRGQEQGVIEALVGGVPRQFDLVSMGNPHAVCFHPQIPESELDVLGPALSARFEQGSNIEIATVESPTRIVTSVWERGVGRTLACGTGAAATAVAAVRRGLSPFDTPIEVVLPGGPLTITVTHDLDVTLRGPARFVFRGEATTGDGAME